MSALLDADGLPILKEGIEPPPAKPQGAEPDWTKTPFPIELFNDRIAIRRDDRESMTDGGLVLPPQAQKRPMTGTVVQAGPGIMRGDGTHLPMIVKIGDRVVFEQFRQMTPVTVMGFVYHLLNANDLLGRAQGAVRITGDKAVE